ncbi:MAG: hypothetical protein J6K25_01595 [Thermoguttaceae bacterium]|nr:hypothetical protein [Thermoguttaceae bacterium]
MNTWSKKYRNFGAYFGGFSYPPSAASFVYSFDYPDDSIDIDFSATITENNAVPSLGNMTIGYYTNETLGEFTSFFTPGYEQWGLCSACEILSTLRKKGFSNKNASIVFDAISYDLPSANDDPFSVKNFSSTFKYRVEYAAPSGVVFQSSGLNRMGAVSASLVIINDVTPQVVNAFQSLTPLIQRSVWKSNDSLIAMTQLYGNKAFSGGSFNTLPLYWDGGTSIYRGSYYKIVYKVSPVSYQLELNDIVTNNALNYSINSDGLIYETGVFGASKETIPVSATIETVSIDVITEDEFLANSTADNTFSQIPFNASGNFEQNIVNVKNKVVPLYLEEIFRRSLSLPSVTLGCPVSMLSFYVSDINNNAIRHPVCQEVSR